ncbi:VOC family protein [Actinospongicola halichondriae]|uniref:VOC family protein n=1 Tax=Actinospongicola halichondriae TaxID=3236844 RepID=UPI003D49A0C3
MSGHPESINAVTLGSTDLVASHAFYTALGFLDVAHGTPAVGFISFRVGPNFLNLQAIDAVDSRWGRFIVHVDDVDALHQRAIDAGLTPSMSPSDAPWGERYFHISDPDGHEVSFARPL